MRLFAFVLLPLLLVGCAPQRSAQSEEITVFAAASLSAAFDELAADFHDANPDIVVAPIVYDGSSTLVTQLSEGAEANVLATADEANMGKAVAAGLAAEPQLFASNTLVIATPADNPAGVTSLADLADVTTILCAPEVPCGAASQALLAKAGIEVVPASLEQNVTSVLTKVSAGEADAGLVYATDVARDDSVAWIVPDGAADVVNRYPIVALDGAGGAADAFIDYVLSPAGQAVLESYGFGAP